MCIYIFIFFSNDEDIQTTKASPIPGSSQNIEKEELLRKIDHLQTINNIQAKQQKKTEKEFAELRQEHKKLLEKYLNAKDSRFQTNEKFFQGDLGQDREEVAERIRERLDDAIDINNVDPEVETENQIKTLVLRMTQCQALEAPYKDVWLSTIENVFQDRMQESNFDSENLIGLVGQNYVTKVCFDWVVDHLRRQIKSPKAFPLKTSDLEDILDGKDVTSLKIEVQKFDKVLVPILNDTKDRSHWLMFQININNNKTKTIKCINSTRLSTLVHDKNEGEQYFKDMEKIASRLFPEKCPEKINQKGTHYDNLSI